MNDKNKGLPSPEAPKSKLMAQILKDTEAPVEAKAEAEVEEKPKKVVELFTVKAIRKGFFKGSRKTEGDMFRVSEKEFSSKWMIKI